MKISTIVHEAHTIALSKGWHERPACSSPGHFDAGHYVGPNGLDLDVIARLLLLTHSEIGEAWKCYQSSHVPWPGVDPTTLSREQLRRYPAGQRLGTSVVGWRLGWTDVKGKPEGMIVELADVVLRVCDLAGALGLRLDASEAGHAAELSDLRTDCKCVEQEHFGELRHCLDRATECLRENDTEGMATHLAVLLAECQRMADYFQLDLSEAVRNKIAYNRTRPHRHGGKAL